MQTGEKEQNGVAMKELRLLFLVESDKKIERLKDALGQVCEGSEKGIEEIYWVLQNLVGSGGSYGFSYVSELAGRGAKLCERHLQSKSVPPGEVIRELENVIDMLKIYFDRVISNGGKALPEDAFVSPRFEKTLPREGNNKKVCEEKACYRVLVADGDEANIKFISWALGKSNFEVIEVRTAKDAFMKLLLEKPDLMITGYSLDDTDGISFITRVRNDTRLRLIPILLVADGASPDSRVNALSAGANQYLMKPFHPKEIEAAVKAEIERSREVASMTIHDTLTGAYSRRYILERLMEETNAHRRKMKPFAVAIIDLDHFKFINDNYGHLMGDEVLRRLTDFMNENLRNSDVLGRYGGEEFIVLMLDTNLDQAMMVINRLREKWVKGTVNITGVSMQITTSFSGGIAVFDRPGIGPEDLLREADKALYTAKNAGRNRICSGERSDSEVAWS